ncbi:MAG: xanthine dehydrogenase accessory protein XdhC [Burkholderiales bacterium]|nr:xanthine dehydrogenase accessory protein XdhC [Burkholderiales bacterium]
MTPQALREAALRWLDAGRAAAVVEVVAARGSVPRGVGTRMLVAGDEVLGTIGGGHLELRAIEDARRLLREGGAPVRQQVALGPALGQCCGGSLELRLAPLQDAEPAAWALPAPRFHLQLYGAGHVGRAIAALLADIPCRVQWIDEREGEFPAAPSPPHIERLAVEPVQAEVDSAPPMACYLVLTHSHALDLALAQAILGRGDFAYFGLIGSATKRARFEHRLRDRGFAPALVERMVCPIGLPGIAGKEPAVIALAAVAQLLQHSPPPAGPAAVPAR